MMACNLVKGGSAHRGNSFAFPRLHVPRERVGTPNPGNAGPVEILAWRQVMLFKAGHPDAGATIRLGLPPKAAGHAFGPDMQDRATGVSQLRQPANPPPVSLGCQCDLTSRVSASAVNRW